MYPRVFFVAAGMSLIFQAIEVQAESRLREVSHFNAQSKRPIQTAVTNSPEEVKKNEFRKYLKNKLIAKLSGNWRNNRESVFNAIAVNQEDLEDQASEVISKIFSSDPPTLKESTNVRDVSSLLGHIYIQLHGVKLELGKLKLERERRRLSFNRNVEMKSETLVSAIEELELKMQVFQEMLDQAVQYHDELIRLLAHVERQ